MDKSVKKTSWNKGLKMSREFCEKISKTKKRLHEEGKLFTEEHKKNIAQALTGSKRAQPAWNKGKKCPKWSKENHWNWKGGIKNDNDRRKSYENVLWRESVFERDNWTCQKCLERGGVIRAHHLKNYAEHTDLRTDVNNGITLCDACHRFFHRLYGKKGNSREQMVAFLLDCNIKELACQKPDKWGMKLLNQQK